MTGPLHDAFRRDGLGPTAGRILELVQKKPGMTATEITRLIGMDRSTVYRNLRRLHDAALLCSHRHRWYPVVRDLDEVAREIGVAGTLDRQRREHQRQRNSFALARNLRSQREGHFRCGT